MNHLKILFCILLASVSVSTSAAIVNVESLEVSSFDFAMTTLPPAGHGDESSSDEIVNSGADLIAGAVDPVLSFVLADVIFDTAGSEKWLVKARTKAATTATIDTDTNMITINLGGWSTEWTQLDFTAPRIFRGCNGSSFPLCDDLDQSPASGSVTGPWDPLTGAFTVSWTRNIAAHPFPEGVGNWTLRGVAPVPLPGAMWFLMSALGGLGISRMFAGKSRSL